MCKKSISCLLIYFVSTNLLIYFVLQKIIIWQSLGYNDLQRIWFSQWWVWFAAIAFWQKFCTVFKVPTWSKEMEIIFHIKVHYNSVDSSFGCRLDPSTTWSTSWRSTATYTCMTWRPPPASTWIASAAIRSLSPLHTTLLPASSASIVRDRWVVPRDVVGINF